MDKELSKFIKQQIKEKYKSREIVGSLINNGYNEKDAKKKVYSAISLRYLKITGITILSIIIFSFLVLWLYFFFTEKTIPINEINPSNQKNWVVKTETNESLVDVSLITKGNSLFEGSDQIYNIPFTDITTLFKTNGFYKGSYFEGKYNNGNKDLIKIGNQMRPGDGVIEGFMIERINDYKNNNLSVFIFVDSDWKNAMPNTKVFFGSKYQYKLDYKFNEISPGIYMFEIYDDTNRHFQNFSISYGGIAVGDLSDQDIINNNIENKTFMRLYS